MSFYRFNDTVTLYTLIEENYYERRVIPAVKIQVVDSEKAEERRATVYIPIYGRRSLKYRAASDTAKYDKSSFIVTAGQLIYLGYCPDDYPPDSALTVQKAETHLSGSRHIQHVKLIAYNTSKEDE